MDDFFKNLLDTKDHSDAFTAEDINKNKAVAIIACFWVLFFVPLVAAKDSGFAKFYANQGLILFLTTIVLNVAGGILANIPFIGFVLRMILSLASLGLFVFLLVNAANGKAKEMPIVGGLFTAFQ